MMIDRKELKTTAKMRISQANPGHLRVMLLYVLAAVAVPQAALTFVSFSTPTGLMDQLFELVYSGIDMETALRLLQIPSQQIILRQVLNVVLQIYQLIMAFGLTRYCLLLYRGETSGPADLFIGFSMAGRVLGANLLVGLIVGACCVALIFAGSFVIAFFVIFLPSLPEIAVWGLLILFWLAALACLVLIWLNYALTTLALADRPELGAMGAIQYGKNLIRGHRGQYFVLSLSFLGWSLLCSLPVAVFSGLTLYLDLPAWAVSVISVVLGLPVYLWLSPYMNAAVAGFYDALHRAQTPQFPPVGPGIV